MIRIQVFHAHHWRVTTKAGTDVELRRFGSDSWAVGRIDATDFEMVAAKLRCLEGKVTR